jgi:peptidase M1-like protein
LARGGRERGQRYLRIVSQFQRAEDLSDTTAAADSARLPLTLEAYRIEATIPKSLDFSATAAVRLTARRNGVRWARFRLLSELKVDSLRPTAGAGDTFFRAEHGPELWVRFGTPLKAGETHEIQVSYHGDLIGYGSVMRDILPREHMEGLPAALDHWFYVKSSSTWFPRYGDPAEPANVELTFHTFKKYHFASIGRLVDSRVDGDFVTTHWVTERPADQVCFSVGEFDELNIARPGVPPVTVQINTDAHRQLRQLILGPQAPEEDVGQDVANSLAFFTRVYGPPLYQRYYAAEIPFPYGQAFPGLVYLSVWTFQSLSTSGQEEMFRSHEIAHQWWGVGVEPAGYRDRWMSEGFAEFSGLWYMQIVLADNDKFFKKLKDWRREIRAHRNDAPPLGLGPRVSEYSSPSVEYYELLVYGKGAWVLHMLRNMMIDFRTMQEDAFMSMMQDFYQQYRGRRASTQDFQRVVERYTGLSMDWFFNEWVNGTAVPTYIFSWRSEPQADGKYLVHVRVRQEDVPPGFVMPVPLAIDLVDHSQAFVRLIVRGASVEAAFTLPSQPKQLTLNPFESVLAEVKTEDWR